MTSPLTTRQLQQLATTELSSVSRFGYVALLLVALAMTIVIASLWLTEAALPLRAQLAFAVLIVIGLSWAVFSVWALASRRVLLGWQSVVAGRMAVTFTTVFVMGALVIGYATNAAAAYGAAVLGFAMLACAVAVLRRAHRTFADLTERRRTLERELEKDRA